MSIEGWPAWMDCDTWPFAVRASGTARVQYVSTRGAGEGGGSAELPREGKPSGLAELFFCESCSKVLTRHPRDVLDEIDSYYCPQSLDNLPSSEAAQYKNKSARVFECPVCSNLLSTHGGTAATVAAALGTTAGEEPDAPRFYFFCQHCRWDSLELGLVGGSPDTLGASALEAESARAGPGKALIIALVEHFQGVEEHAAHVARRERENRRKSAASFADSAEPPPRVQEPLDANELWRWKECDAACKLREARDLQVELLEPSANVAQALESLASAADRQGSKSLPERVALRTKRSVRCRACVLTNSANIVLKPQINPLKGDSSMRTNVGAWFKKKSLAYDLLPRCSARRLDDGRLVLAFTNPRDADLEIALGQGPWMKVDAYDEIEEIDMFSSKRAPRGLGPVAGQDPPCLLSRLGNKVLVELSGVSELPVEIELRFRVAASAECDEEAAPVSVGLVVSAP